MALLRLNTDLRVDGNGGRIGKDLNLENDLGAPPYLLEPAAAVRWRPGRPPQLELGDLFSPRSDEGGPTRTIHLALTRFTAGVGIKSAFRGDQATLNYRFAFHAGERNQMGVGVGVGVILLREEITAGVGVVTTGGPVGPTYSASKSFNGP